MANPERIIKFRAIAAELAPLLGLVVEPFTDGGNDCYARLKDPADQERGLLLCLESYPRDPTTLRTEVSCYWPHHAGPHTPACIPRDLIYKATCPSANVSLLRPVATLAADIKRRVLEPYAPLYAKLRAHVDEQAAWRRQRVAEVQALYDQIDPAMKPKLRLPDNWDGEPTISFGDYDKSISQRCLGDLRWHSDGFELKAHGVSAAAVLALLNTKTVTRAK